MLETMPERDDGRQGTSADGEWITNPFNCLSARRASANRRASERRRAPPLTDAERAAVERMAHRVEPDPRIAYEARTDVGPMEPRTAAGVIIERANGGRLTGSGGAL